MPEAQALLRSAERAANAARSAAAPGTLTIGHSGNLVVTPGRASVTLADFADEPLVRYPAPDADAFWCIDRRPDGRPAPAGPTVEDKLELVAAGDALSLAPDGDGRTLRRDLAFVPVVGLEPCRVVLVARPGDSGSLIDNVGEAFLNARTTVPTRPAADQ
ncbi:hypothetical protein [Cryptosporangium sp. NPDC051539]|uniref:hypothetical protein n=1 Tax=Cryptosporangium sp. NPDC051539 TaxID=3363962 RepID=UPI0037A63BAC